MFHLAVHRRCDREVLLRLLPLAGAPEELAQAEVAVGDERAVPRGSAVRVDALLHTSIWTSAPASRTE